jgi:hypothetical protein
LTLGLTAAGAHAADAVDLRDKKGTVDPKDLKKADPPPPKVQKSEPPPPSVRSRSLIVVLLALAGSVGACFPAQAEVKTLICTWLGGNGWMDMTLDVDLARSTLELVAPMAWGRAEPATITSRYITSGKIRIDLNTGSIVWGVAGDPPGQCKAAPGNILK